jgi:hypothetical protein
MNIGDRITTLYEHSATGVIVRPSKSALPLPGDGWHVVRFDDTGGEMCIHESMMAVRN